MSPMLLIDRKGRRFGRLIVVRLVESGHPASVWLCRCDCGNWCRVTGAHLDRTTRSCGCLNDEKRAARAQRAALVRWGHA
jgi:hypothetical protein